MALDKDTLKCLKDRALFKQYIGSIDVNIFEETTRTLLKAYSRYFKQFKECSIIEKEPFLKWFFSLHKKDTDDELLYRTLLDDLDEPLHPTLVQFLPTRWVETTQVSKMIDVITRWNDGDEVNLAETLHSISNKLVAVNNRTDVIKPIDFDMQTEVEHELNDWGFEWRMECLQNSMRKLRPADFIIMAARVDSGKTTLVANEVVHFAKQTEVVYGERKNIIWFNNESAGNRIKWRLMQSALGCTVNELIELWKEGTLERKYAAALGGTDNIVVHDVHNRTTAELERYIERYDPALIVFDMLDHVKYVEEGRRREGRTDEYLEGLYVWGRSLATIYNCPVIATSQFSADAENMSFPLLSQLKDSKTGKQGQADACIYMGKLEDPLRQNDRFIGIPKNKLRQEGKKSDPRCEVRIDQSRAQFIEG